jgi:hypothetical protein
VRLTAAGRCLSRVCHELAPDSARTDKTSTIATELRSRASISKDGRLVVEVQLTGARWIAKQGSAARDVWPLPSPVTVTHSRQGRRLERTSVNQGIDDGVDTERVASSRLHHNQHGGVPRHRSVQRRQSENLMLSRTITPAHADCHQAVDCRSFSARTSRNAWAAR